MLLIHGRRTTRIKKITDNQHYCRSCNSFDLVVKVYREYYHFYLIPFIPVGSKTVDIVCKTCGEPYRVESVQKDYERQVRTPVYLYAGLILIAGLIGLGVNEHIRTQKEKRRFVENPKVGDVYTIRKDENDSTKYFFLRLSKINGDTVYVYHNNLVYSRFVTTLNEDDFFDRDEELGFTKGQLKKMLDSDEINAVERNYGPDNSFDRVK